MISLSSCCSFPNPYSSCVASEMEGRGGCCIARYGGGDVASKVDRIMLRFRPIAPKPVAPTMSDANTVTKTESSDSATNRGRRRSSSGGGSGGSGKESRRGRKRRGAKAEEAVEDDEVRSSKKTRSPPDPITLPLMPETPERMHEVAMERNLTPSPPSNLVIHYVPPPWYNVRPNRNLLAPMPVRPAGSVVTMECVTTEMFSDVTRLHDCKADEVRSISADDISPAFGSDEYDRVTWTNAAYKRMVGEVEEERRSGGGAMRVALITRGKVPTGVTAFGCRVRVKYAFQREKGALTAPCDVCRLVDGGLVWRLDVDTALSLGR